MLLGTTYDMVRIMGGWVRLADAGLVRGAARNAAACMAEQQARRLDEARTMRDLRSIEGTIDLRPDLHRGDLVGAAPRVAAAPARG